MVQRAILRAVWVAVLLNARYRQHPQEMGFSAMRRPAQRIESSVHQEAIFKPPGPSMDHLKASCLDVKPRAKSSKFFEHGGEVGVIG